MTTVEVYERLKTKFQQAPAVLLPSDLEGLSAQLQVSAAVATIRCYFPDQKMSLTGVKPLTRPDSGKRFEVHAVGSAPPFVGMPVRLEIWTEEKTRGVFELHMNVSAYGAAAGAHWTLGQAIPFYQGSLIGDMRLPLSEDSKYPLLTLSSHPGGNGGIPAIYCKGLVDLNSIAAVSPSLFLGDEARNQYGAVAGTMLSLEPFAAGDARNFHPAISLYTGLPDLREKRKLGTLLPIDNIRYAVNARPDLNLATSEWETECYFIWSADVELKPAGGGANAVKLPLGVEVTDNGSSIRFWSSLTEALPFAWDSLAGCFPGFPRSLPDTGFRLQDDVRLGRVEILAERDANRGLKLASISLNIETNEDKNRWVIVEDLLTLDAIDFSILITNPEPPGTPNVFFGLTGLIGIGEKATMRLTGDLSHAGGETDYGFTGHLLEDESLKINEVLTHFLGHSDFPSIPDLTVEAFSFSVRPRSKLYYGEIKLSADWPLIGKLSLRGVYFRMHHDAGEGDTSFEANGVFEIAGIPVYVSADYVSNGRGWTFSGGTFDDEEIEIGVWLTGVWALWAPARIPALPPALKDLVLVNLGIRFNTTTGDYSFQGTARFPIDGKTESDNSEEIRSNAELTVQVDREGDTATFRGMLTMFQRDFEVVYHSSGLLVASYDGTAAEPVDLKQFISEISRTLGGSVASGIKINLSHAQLAYSNGDVKKFLFAVDLDAGIQLSNLPLVGFLFDQEQTLSVVFQFLAVNRAFEADEIRSINELAAPEMTKIPAKRIGGARPDDSDFRLEVAVKFGGETHPVSLPLNTDVRSTPASNKMPVDGSASKAVYWVKIDKALGPFHFQRLGLGTDGRNLEFLMDASLQTAGLTITLDGLEARCSFTDLSKGTFHPAFGLSGLGIAFRSGDLEIGGALVQREGANVAFDGALVIRYKRLGIEAVGAYETVAGFPSLFVYALIDYPLGGPAFFFVEGGAVGFGYNRSLTMPRIDQVSEFPLIKQATAAKPSRLTPLQLADQLKPHITPVAGQYFITAGIKFSSFKTIKGFVLLTVLFGDHFEIDVLGKATLTSPPDVDSSKALMLATLLLLGRFLPEEGVLMVMAELGPDARLFAPDCHLTGGFALYCWFDGERKGDFVLTLGGYHKLFAVPDYYPKVPRLGMNWQVNRNLSIKAEAYFALTPSALMAGGKLEANWQSGDLHAWFRAEVDFLIAWQPFYYDGHAYVSLGARYRFNFFGQHEISAELTAELDVWGPPFSGRARVQWNLISFEVAFGDKERHRAPALDWIRFRKSFLPEGNLFTVTAEGGKVAQGDGSRTNDAYLGCLNPRNLCIAVRSPMPVKIASKNLLEHALESSPGAVVKEPELGIAPMNRTKSQWKSFVSVTILRGNGGTFTEDMTTQFQATRIRNNVPVSLWGQTMDPKDRKKDEPQVLKDAICGYEIRPSKPSKSTTDPQAFTVTSQGRGIRLEKPQPLKGIEGRISSDLAVDVTAGLLNADVQKRRRGLLMELLPETDVNWGSVTVASWRGSPRIVKQVR